jgi:hypothetical protein
MLMRPPTPHAVLVSSLAAVALLVGCGGSPTAAAEPVSAEQVEAILGALRTGPAAYERTVVVDSRTVGGGFGDARLSGRYSEIQHRESARRARVVYRTAREPNGYTVTRHDGEVFLAIGDEPARRVGGPLLRVLKGMVPVPIRAEDVAVVDTTSTSDGGSRVLVRLKRPDPARLIGRDREAVPSQVARQIRAGQETAELELAADGRLVRLTQRFGATIDGRALTAGLPLFGPQGTVRMRFSSTLTVAPAPQEPVVPPAATGTVTDEAEFALLLDEPISTPEPPDPDAAPSGDARAIALARRANAGFRDVSGFTAALRVSLPGGSGVVRVQAGLRDGLIEVVRTSLGAGVEVVSTRGSQFTFDPFGRCWDRDPLTFDPFTPWEPGRAPISLRGSRFFAPEPAGRLVRIVAERTLEGLPMRVRFTLDRRSGRLLAAETMLTKGRVTIRPGLTVEPPTPVC